MKYVAIAVLIIAAIFAGCLRPAIDTKIPPVAIIDLSLAQEPWPRFVPP